MHDVIIFDIYSTLFKEFHALKELKNSRGWGTAMAFGAVKQFFYLFTKYGWRSNHVILAWDRKPLWKYELFPGYKAKRKQLDLPPAMAVPAQLKICKKLFDLMGMQQVYSENNESDDACATIAAAFNRMKKKCLIVSTDHDMYQCLNKNTELLIHTDNTEELFTEEKFINQFKISPSIYHQAQTLGGCTTDKVPGMVGISVDTAIEILKLNSWDEILKNAADLKFPDKRSSNAFKKAHPTWNPELMSKLVKLNTAVKLKVEKPAMNPAGLRALFLLLEFKHYLLPDNFDKIVKLFSR